MTNFRLGAEGKGLELLRAMNFFASSNEIPKSEGQGFLEEVKN